MSNQTDLNLITIEQKYFSYDSIKNGESVEKSQEGQSHSNLQGQFATPEFLHNINEPWYHHTSFV